jgi:hypothetical protein
MGLETTKSLPANATYRASNSNDYHRWTANIYKETKT